MIEGISKSVEARSKHQTQLALMETIDAAKDYLREDWPNIRVNRLREPISRSRSNGSKFRSRMAGSESSAALRRRQTSIQQAIGSLQERGLINSWCKSPSYNGIIRARSNSTPARPYMARLRVFSLLICPSVCPLLQGSDIAFRTASRSWRIVFAKRCIA